MTDHTPRAVFDAHRAEIERQVSTIIAARGTDLGKRTVLCEVFRHGSGKRLADVVRTTHGPVVVTYRSTDDRVTGDVNAIAPLTDQDDQQFPIAAPEPASALPATELRAAVAAGRRKIVHYADITDIARRLTYGTDPEAKPLTKAIALRNKLRNLLQYNRTQPDGAPKFNATEEELLQAEAECERLADADAEKRAARRNPPRNT